MNTETNRNRSELTALVHQEMIRLLYLQFIPASLVSITVSLLITVTLWPVQDHDLLLTWFGLLTLSSIIRIVLITSYKRINPQNEAVLAWEKPYFITLMISCFLWGIGSVIIIPAESSYYQAIVFYCLIGISGGAVSIYFSRRRMVLLAITLLLLPMTVWMFWQATWPSLVMAIGALLFFVSIVQATQVLESTIHQNFILNYELQDTNAFIENLARTDALTGLLNRRAFYEQANVLSTYAERHHTELAVIVFDLDLFKTINDTHGHAAGDAVLEHIGQLLKKTLRKSDLCARIGGEEFIILLADDIESAYTLAEKLRHVLETSPITFQEKQLVVTGCFGVAGNSLNIDQLMKQADAAMYKAKESGRNRVATDVLLTSQSEV